MERYSTNDDNQFFPKVTQLSETVFHSNQVLTTNQFGQLCYMTTGQKQVQSGLPTLAVTTTASQSSLQLHIPENIAPVCNSNTTTSHNTTGVYGKHIVTSVSSDNQTSPELHTSTPHKTSEDSTVAKTSHQSFQNSSNINSAIYERQQQQQQQQSQKTGQRSTVLMKTNPRQSPLEHQQQLSNPDSSTAVTTTKPSLATAESTVGSATPTAPMVSHQQGRAYYHCDICLKPFAQRHYLAIHKRSHTGEKPFQCDFCIQKFARRDTLQIHRRIHTGEKPFHCEVCSKQFAQRDKLQIHRRTHSRKKKFHCDICFKQFAQQDYVEIHKRSHTGEKPFQCDFCMQKFVRKNTLDIHRRMHTGERPYHCEICGETFAQTEKLRRHKKSAHSVTGGTSSTGGNDSGCVKSSGSNPSTSSPGPVPTSNMVALAAVSSKIIEDYPTISNQLWLL